jgi:ATP-binding protein involved in chromosome partitioning
MNQSLCNDDIVAMLSSIVDASQISGIVVRAGKVGLVLQCDAADVARTSAQAEQIKTRLLHDARIDEVTVVLSSEREGSTTASPAPAKKAVWNGEALPHVKRIIVVASGKGGVGKSTVTALLAVSLKAQGLHVGILDADIYGPSIAHMFGLSHEDAPEVEDNIMIPPEVGGITIMSLGLLLDPKKAAIMRGAMVSKTVQQLLRGVRWGTADAPLDVLLIDMPPGTGDVHLSLVQSVPMHQHQGRAILVTTPQEVALLDARKCAVMFAKVAVPLMGVIENMSYFEDDRGIKHHLFGQGGGASLAAEYGTNQLAELPIMPEIRALADAGKMINAPFLWNIDI